MFFVIGRYALALLILGCVLAPPAALAERRLALAIGIDLYDNLPASEQLKKAVNDARAVGAALRNLGFEATVEENISRLAFMQAWQRFLNRLEPGDVAALFFSGHGVEIGGLNYLLPRDVPRVGLSEDRVLAGGSIRFNDLMDDLRDKRARVSLIIIDACRDNPFRAGQTRSVGAARGLSRVEPAKGSFVMYSAGAGEKAIDGLGGADADPNSPYTRTLLLILQTPGLSLQQIATRVRNDVVELARRAYPPHEQTPAYYDQLLGEFVLRPDPAPSARPNAPPSAAAPETQAAREWMRLDKSSREELETFWRRHPMSPETEYALARLAALRKADEKKAPTAPASDLRLTPLGSNVPVAGSVPPYPAPNNAGQVLEGLAGTWRGTYAYADRSQRPVEFTLTLDVYGNVCRGRTEEPNTFGHRSAAKLFANIECNVTMGVGPPKLTLRKVYDGTGGQTHGVSYTGEISADGRSIGGTWTTGTTSGRFSMIKQ
jgi:uncharacterized caspase-like protein